MTKSKIQVINKQRGLGPHNRKQVMAKMNFGGVEENVVTRSEFPLEKAREVLKNETIAVLGYGVQGPGQ